MSEASQKLQLPYMQVNQAGKDVTYNEAMKRLDVLVDATVKNLLTAPPGNAVNGDNYIVVPTATSYFQGKEGMIASYLDGNWDFYAPYDMMQATNASNGDVLQYSASANAWSVKISGGTGGGRVTDPIFQRNTDGDIFPSTGDSSGTTAVVVKYGTATIGSSFTIEANASHDVQVPVSGAAKGDPAACGYTYSGSLPSTMIFSAIANADNNVAVRFINFGTSQITVPAGTLKAAAMKSPV